VRRSDLKRAWVRLVRKAPRHVAGVAAVLALLLGAARAPLHLVASHEAQELTSSLQLGASATAANAAPFAWLGTKLFSTLPLGSWPLRAHLFATVALALALGCLAALLSRTLVFLAGGPGVPAQGSQHARHSQALVHAVVVLGVVIAVLFAQPIWEAGQSSVQLATSLAFLALCLLLQSKLIVQPGLRPAGLHLALAAGLLAGVDPLLSALIWPPYALTALWALRSGYRWPRAAPFVFAAGFAVTAVVLVAPLWPQGTWADITARLSLSDLRASLFAAKGAGAYSLLQSFASDLGLVACLLAALGWLVMARRTPAFAASAAYGIWVVLLWAAARPEQPPLVASAALVFLSAPPLLAGIVYLAQQVVGEKPYKQVPAVATLTLLALAAPVISSGSSWSSSSNGPNGSSGSPRSTSTKASPSDSPIVAAPARAHDDHPDAVESKPLRTENRQDVPFRVRPVCTLDTLMHQAYGQLPVRAHVDPGSPALQQMFDYGALVGLRPDVSFVTSRAADDSVALAADLTGGPQRSAEPPGTQSAVRREASQLSDAAERRPGR